MTLTLILFALPVIAALVALIRERGEDSAFAGDKVGYRS